MMAKKCYNIDLTYFTEHNWCHPQQPTVLIYFLVSFLSNGKLVQMIGIQSQ